MLSPGTHLGPHEIVAPLGAGDVGDVYHTRDERIAQDVAIRALPVFVSTVSPATGSMKPVRGVVDGQR